MTAMTLIAFPGHPGREPRDAHPSVSCYRSVSCGATPHETLARQQTLGWTDSP